jgi:poly(hydroxyalkanoate) depolymerase family esterase
MNLPNLAELLAPNRSDARFTSGSFANMEASRPYRLYVPRRPLPPQPALMVMLHGCTQSPEDFATGTRMNALAERHGFLALYPGQVSSANANLCWNWFRGGDQARDRGEPGLIAGLVHQVMAEHRVDPKRVFAAGLSAGGAMVATLGALYPDLFAAIGIHSGLPHGAATDMVSAFAAMRQGRAGRGRIEVPAIIFQGDRDATVNAANAAELAAQAKPKAAVLESVTRGEAGHAYTCRRLTGSDGRSLLETWTIHGGGHAWSGGDPAGSFSDAKGPDASGEMLRFFFAR